MNQSQQVIWVLEDDPGSWFVLEEILGIRYRLLHFDSIVSLHDAFLIPDGPPPDLLIADLRLPGESFLHFLSSPQAIVLKGIPFVVISSVDDLDALRFCFEKGAADYLTKPFGKSELVVKVERIMEEQRSEMEGIQLDPVSLTAQLGRKRSERLTSKEFQILSVLLNAYPGRMERRELVDKVWEGVRVEPNTLDVHLSKLRHKLSGLGVKISNPVPLECQIELGH